MNLIAERASSQDKKEVPVCLSFIQKHTYENYMIMNINEVDGTKYPIVPKGTKLTGSAGKG